MSYSEFVGQNSHIFTAQGLLGKAQDAAKILDNPLFVRVPQEKMVCLIESLADVGNYFRYISRQCGLDLPEELLRFTNNQRVLMPQFQAVDPGKTAQVMVVDNSLMALIDTARAFMGWPNLFLSHYYFRSGACSQADAEQIVKDILEADPDIVLMDQGLGDIKGYDLVRALNEVTKEIIFVANTDSEDDSHMIAVGCLSNCGKGAFPEGLRNALKKFKGKVVA